MTINLSLARGLRQRALDTFRAMAAAYSAVLDEMHYAAMSGKWTGKRVKEFERLLIKRVNRRTFLALPTLDAVHHFAPLVEGDRLLVEIVRVELPRRRRPEVLVAPLPLVFGHHAIERLFMRLDTTDPEVVGKEIRQALLVAIAMEFAVSELKLRQFAIPTEHGCFLGTYEEGLPPFVRTWVRYNDPNRGAQAMSSKWEGLARQIALHLEGFLRAHHPHGPVWLIEAAIGMREEATDLKNWLVRAMQPFWWLRDPYEAAVDHAGDAWAKARAAANQAESGNKGRP